MDSKQCSKCKTIKPVSEFGKNRRAKDGRTYVCKACNKQYREENRERILESKARYRSKHKDAIAEYRRANRDRILDLQAQWRAKNEDKIRAEKAEYYKRVDPSRHWESTYRSRTKRFGFVGQLESFTKADLIDRYGDECFHCGGPFEQLDHYPVPVVRGGSHSLENCKPSCAACNHDSWVWSAEQVSV